ncbi:MAG: ABC transporter ATP-binding protein [Firmicutes bacterium]|nr:ABC transporter ATP-binding protein [Bacillota bacterium]
MLEIKRIQAQYREVPVLWDASLMGGRGEIVALLGANGAGKTTLMRAVTGLREGFLDVTGGDVTFQGQSIAHLDASQIVKLGIAHVPEGRHLFPGLTTLENLLVGSVARLARGQRREALERVFELMPRLFERRHQLAGTMSGGEQQMLAIGRALMQNPTLLLLDEPSQGLAPRMVAALFEIMVKVRQAGVTVLIAEQNAHQVLSLADRAYVLEHGRITLEGAGSQLLEHPTVRRAYLGL